MTRRATPERTEQTQIVRTLRALGWPVYVLGTTRRRSDSHFGTMQSHGLPDLVVVVPERMTAHRVIPPRLLAIEVKAPRGQLRPEQAELREQWLSTGQPHLVGGLDVVYQWLIAEGYVRAASVPWYRQGEGAA